MLRQQDIIKDVKDGPTPWISPIVVVPKNHDKTKIRPRIDMREANKAIERTRYPSPSLEYLINILQGSKFTTNWIWIMHFCNLNKNQLREK